MESISCGTDVVTQAVPLIAPTLRLMPYITDRESLFPLRFRVGLILTQRVISHSRIRHPYWLRTRSCAVNHPRAVSPFHRNLRDASLIRRACFLGLPECLGRT